MSAALIIVLGAVYAIYSPQRKPIQSNVPGDAATRPLNSGKMIAFVIKKPHALPALEFLDGTGAKRRIAEWRGKVVLINLWATWCAPCRKEMPALARLDLAFAGQPFDVVAVSIDRKGIDVSRKFLKQAGAERLGLYVDPSGKIARDLRTFGLPSSVLIDAQGREIGRLTGIAEWDSEDAKRLIRAALDGKLTASR